MLMRRSLLGLFARLQRENIQASGTVFGCNRLCSRSSTTIEKNITTEAPVTEEKTEVFRSSTHASVKGHRPSELDKTILVKTGRYKTKEDIPDFVSDDTINRAKSKTRIFINICMAGVLMVAIVFMIRKGRRDVDDGQSLSLMNMRRHPQIYQAAIEEEEQRHNNNK